MKTEIEGENVAVRHLVLDTTKLSAKGAAQEIIKWLCGQQI